MVPLTFGHSTTVVGVAPIELEDFEDVFEAEDVDFEAGVGNCVVLRREEEAAIAGFVGVPVEGALLLLIFSFALSRRCTSTGAAYPARAFELVLFFLDASAPPTPPPTAIISATMTSSSQKVSGLKPHSLRLRSNPGS